MIDLSDLIKEHKNNIVNFIDGVQINAIKYGYNKALEDLLSKVKSNHYLLNDKINTTDYGMFTCGIEQVIAELKR